MAVKRRAQQIEATRAKLIQAGRQAFATQGYAAASMDDLTAKVGLTRGALYHHFGDKKGLLLAVIHQMDMEMLTRMRTASAHAPTTWHGFINESIAYMEMALEPEIQRIVLLDGPAVLGSPTQWPNQNVCLRATMDTMAQLIEEDIIQPIDTEAAARMLNGAALHAALWIANAEQPQAVLNKAIDAFCRLAEGLLK